MEKDISTSDLEKLLGKVPNKLEKSGGYPPDFNQLLEVKEADVITRSWCESCGTCLDIVPELKAIIMRKNNLAEPENWDNKYILVTGCLGCGEDFENPKICEIN
jgi:hypothetical protein